MPETMASKAKRLSLSIETKREIIRAVADRPGLKKADLARQFGIASSTLWTILKNQQGIVTTSESYEQSRKRIRNATYEDIEEAMLSWLQTMLTNKLPVTGPSIRAEANQLAIKMGHTGFKASSGWLFRFRKRHHRLLSKYLLGQKAPEGLSDPNVDEINHQIHRLDSQEQDEPSVVAQPRVERYQMELHVPSPIPPPSTAEAFHCLSRLQDYFNGRPEASGEDFLRIAGLEASLVQCRKNNQQSKITDFFHP